MAQLACASHSTFNIPHSTFNIPVLIMSVTEQPPVHEVRPVTQREIPKRFIPAPTLEPEPAALSRRRARMFVSCALPVSCGSGPTPAESGGYGGL